MAKSASRAKRNPENPANPENPDSDKRRARNIAAMWFESCSELDLEPFAYCFRDKGRHQIDNIVAVMLGLDVTDSDVQSMLARYKPLFASEPNVNGRQKRILAALAAFS